MKFVKFKNLILTVTLTAVVFAMPFFLCAAEVIYPVAAYSSEELAKVREWERHGSEKKLTRQTLTRFQSS